MDARLIDRIETSVECTASAAFGAAVGYAAYVGLNGVVELPELAICAAAAVIVAHLLSSRALKAIARRGPRFRVRVFDIREIEFAGNRDELILTNADRFVGELVLTDADRIGDELVLTDADRVGAASQADGLLVLDDVLAELGPESRVVRLFDRRTMSTAGQLQSRIDNHLVQGSPLAAQSDASQALSDALAELRRSLR